MSRFNSTTLFVYAMVGTMGYHTGNTLHSFIDQSAVLLIDYLDRKMSNTNDD